MFAPEFWPEAHFAPGYWPPEVIVTPTPGGGGGFSYRQHIVEIEPDDEQLAQNNLALILLSTIY